RNGAWRVLFREGGLRRAGCYERLEYFMGHLAPSGVTGNINRGRLLNDERARALAEQAVRFVGGLTGERAHGLLTVDLREDRTGALKVTQINARHVAPPPALAPRRQRSEHGRGSGACDARALRPDRRSGTALPRRQRDPARHRRRSAVAHRLSRARGRGARLIRRAVVAFALVALVAGCGGS